MPGSIDANTLKDWLHDGRELALLDVREFGQYGSSHLFYGIPLPYSRLELDVIRLVPRTATRIAVYDDGALGVAERAATRLDELGYSNVHVLAGGTQSWSAAGFELFAGVNVPSKTFGELVEHCYRTPRVGASDLAAMMRSGEDLVVLDGRPFSEYQRMSIPGSRCCPNGELAYRIKAIAPRAQTRIIVNCAGRTRGIIGAQTLIDFGIPNPVYALENGTQGWYLADLPLAHGSRRSDLPVPDDADRLALRARAAMLARRHGVRFVDAREVDRWLGDSARTTYLFDVRTREEFIAGTVSGAAHAAGGQLVQATDHWIAVRNARIVVFDDEGVRAPVTASWLRQMGHDAYVLRDGACARVRRTQDRAVTFPELEVLAVDALEAMLAAGSCTVVDLRSSAAYRKAHIPGSTWSIRSRLNRVEVKDRGCVVLIADEVGVARIAAHDLARADIARCALLAGGMQAWQESGLPTEATPDMPADGERIDYLFFAHDRHDGNKDAARQYLEWETNLVSRIDARELASFRLRDPGAPGAHPRLNPAVPPMRS